MRLLPVLFGCFVPGIRSWSCNDPGASEQFERISLASIDQLAVCNDASAAAYYFKDNSNTKLWVVYLSGGGWCYDYESCAARYNGSEYPHHDCGSSSVAAPCFMSSKDFPATCGKTGIFDASSTRSPLFMANKVYIPYCSSDAFMGDGKFHGWEFRGARIVRAVIEDLVSRGLGEGATLIFGGGSAGGRGAMVLLDEIAGSLPNVLVRGFLDSPFYIDIESYSPKFAGFQGQHTAVLNNFNATSVVSADCKHNHPGAELWKCLFGQYRMPFVKTPNLMMASQFDAWQLSHLVHGYGGIETSPTFTASELMYIQEFGRKTYEQIVLLRNFTPDAGMLYSTACYNHHISEKSGFWITTTSAGFSEADAVTQILFGHGYYVDDCSGYNCGKGCGNSQVGQQPEEHLLPALMV